jgi:hypothetical protein
VDGSDHGAGLLGRHWTKVQLGVARPGEHYAFACTTAAVQSPAGGETLVNLACRTPSRREVLRDG